MPSQALVSDLLARRWQRSTTPSRHCAQRSSCERPGKRLKASQANRKNRKHRKHRSHCMHRSHRIHSSHRIHCGHRPYRTHRERASQSDAKNIACARMNTTADANIGHRVCMYVSRCALVPAAVTADDIFAFDTS